ncbi:C2 domain-containing protein [Aphelenchoides bicaudatus]|nr:C2 domain-containing protein [Aphelenchoides bicaudatus]
MQFNTLIVHVVRLKDLPTKGRHHLDAYASLNITGTDKWRSKVGTQPNRVDESGNCHWDEHLEFQLNECYTDFTININHKSKIGSSETLASMTLKLSEMPQMQNARWFQLHKKNHPDKLRGNAVDVL